jgi:hypothetical protein
MRSGQTSDYLLSACFLSWTLNYALYNIPYLFFYRGEQLPPWFALGSVYSVYLGAAALALFTRVVFRSRERWARWLVAGTLGCLIVGMAGSIGVGDPGLERPLSNPWWWVTRVGSLVALGWMGAEAFAEYRKARQRRRLGLCAPLVCNRYLLWGLASAFWVILEFADIADYLVYEHTGQWADAMWLIMGWLEVIPGVLIGLAFFPPAVYRRWIEGDGPSTAGAAIDDSLSS